MRFVARRAPMPALLAAVAGLFLAIPTVAHAQGIPAPPTAESTAPRVPGQRLLPPIASEQKPAAIAPEWSPPEITPPDISEAPEPPRPPQVAPVAAQSPVGEDPRLLPPDPLPSAPEPPLAPGQLAPPPAPASPEVQQAIDSLLQLRRQIGSPMKGTVLDSPGDSRQFAELLREAMSQQPPAEPPPLPPAPQMPAAPQSGDTPDSLLQAANSLDRHAGQLDAQGRPARALRIRRLARRLRSEAAEIREEGY